MASEFSYQDVINNDYPAGVYLKKYDFVTDTEKGDEYWVSEITIYGVPTLTQLGHTVNNTESDQIQVNNLPKLTHKPDAYLDINKVTTLTTGGDALTLGYAIYFGDSVMTGVNTHHYRLFESVSNSVAISANPISTTHILSDSVLALEWDLPNGKYKTPAAMLVNKKLPMGSRVLLVAYDIDDNVISELSLNTVHSRCRSRGLGVINGIELVSPYMSSSDPSLIDIRDRVGTLKLSDFKIKLSYVGSEPTLNNIDGTIFRADGLLDMINTKGDLKSSVTIAFRVPVSGGCHHVSRRYNLVKTYMAPAEIPDFVEVPEAHWILNESEGSILYDNVGGHHAEISGGYTYGQLAMVNRDETAIGTDGTAIAVVQDTELLRPGTGDYAISVWCRWAGSAQNVPYGEIHEILRKSGTSDGFRIYNKENMYYCIEDIDDPDYRFEIYQWQNNGNPRSWNFSGGHALYQRRTIDGVTKLEVYVDGIFLADKILPTLIDHSGNDPITLFDEANGSYSNIHYWANRSFDASEVKAMYDADSQFVTLPRWLGATGIPDQVGFFSNGITDIVTNVGKTGTVIARTGSYHLIRSADHGRTWALCNQVNRPFIDEDARDYGYFENLWKYQRLVHVNGLVWVTVFADGVIGRSIDDGITWTFTQLFPYINAYTSGDLAVDHNNGILFYMSTGTSQPQRSGDGGATWQIDMTLSTNGSSNSNRIKMDCSPTGTWMRSSQGWSLDSSKIQRSTDGGLTWTDFPDRLGNGNSYSNYPLGWWMTDGNVWLVPFKDTNGSISFDDGATWTLSPIKLSEMRPISNGNWFSSTGYPNTTGVYSTENGTFTPSTGPVHTLNSGQFFETYGDNILASQYNNFSGFSVDGGVTWYGATQGLGAGAPVGTVPQVMTWSGGHWIFATMAGYVSLFTPPNRVS